MNYGKSYRKTVITTRCDMDQSFAITFDEMDHIENNFFDLLLNCKIPSVIISVHSTF
jgi:hypothetical protein